jgi:hypothetical protein
MTDELMFVCVYEYLCMHGHERHQVICYLCFVLSTSPSMSLIDLDFQYGGKLNESTAQY